MQVTTVYRWISNANTSITITTTTIITHTNDYFLSLKPTTSLLPLCIQVTTVYRWISMQMPRSARCKDSSDPSATPAQVRQSQSNPQSNPQSNSQSNPQSNSQSNPQSNSQSNPHSNPQLISQSNHIVN